MFPDLARLFFEHPPSWLDLSSFYILMLTGLVAALSFAIAWAKQLKINHDDIIDLFLYAFIVGLFGAHFMHVLADGFFWDYVHLCTDPSLVEWPYPKAECIRDGAFWNEAKSVCQPASRDCLAWLNFMGGGLTFYGSVIAVIPMAWFFLKRRGIRFVKVVDLAAMSLPLGHFLGRLGCFLGGCCFGVHSDHSFALSFPPGSTASRIQAREGLLSSYHQASLPVHPTQLYEAFGLLLIFIVISFVIRPRKRFHGMLGVVYLVLYAFLRFGLEFLRADDRGGFGWFSTSQWIGFGMLGLALALWFWASKSVSSSQAQQSSSEQ